MSRTLLAALGIAVLAAGVAWVLLGAPQRGGDAPAAAAGAAKQVSGAPAPAQAEDLKGRPETSGGPLQDAAAAGAAAPGGRREAAGGLSSESDLQVLVLDSAGKPAAGVPLVLEPELPDNHQVTGEDGRAVFPGARAAMAAGGGFRLVHNLPFETQPVLELDAMALSADPVVSCLPPCGALEVRVRELDGQPAPDGSGVELKLGRTAEDATDPLSSENRPGWAAELRAGSVLYPYVELGREWKALAHRPESDIPSRAAGPGPYAAGERALLEVVLGCDHPVVRLRAVDVAGRPCADAALHVKHEIFFFAQEHGVQTDSGGYFLVDLDASMLFGPASLVVEWRRDGQPLLCGRKELPDTTTPGLVDGGDVVLAPEDLLVAGIVVDETGAPVAGANINAGSNGRISTGVFLIGFSGGQNAESDAQGAFEIHGPPGAAEFGVQAFKSELRSEEVKAHPGDRGLRLVLVRRYRVTGSLLVDEGMNPGVFELLLQDSAQNEAGVDQRTIDGDGSFVLEGVLPGTYELVCRLNGAELARTPAFQVIGDTDAGVLDLRGRMFRHTIVLAGATDPSALRGSCQWRAAGGTGYSSGKDFSGTEIVIDSTDRSLDVRILPEGYLQELLEGVSGRRDVNLRPALVVVLDVQTTGALPVYPYILDPEIVQDGTRVGVPDGSPYLTAEKRSSRFLVSAAGPAQVTWHFEHRGSSWAVGGGVLQGHEVPIEIRNVPGEQHFSIPLDGEALTSLTGKPPF